MKKTQEFGNIEYHQYSKIYYEALKSLSKALIIKKKVNIAKKIDELDKEYCEILKKAGYINIKDERENYANFTDKMSFWYEMKFTDPQVYTIFTNKNLKLEADFFVSSDDAIYDTSTFINKYIPNEKYLLKKATYSKYIYLMNNHYLEISPKGIVKHAHNLDNKKHRQAFIGKHITEVALIAKKLEIDFNEETIKSEIDKYKTNIKLREIILDTIMYKIIKHGGIRIGPRRALLFAKEFNRNIDIPMQYAIDTTDANDITLIKIYLNNGGKKSLELFINYFCEGIENIMFDKITIKEYIKRFASDDIDFYAKEELEEYKNNLYQRMVNSLNNRKLALKLKNKDTDK